jgi:prophage antirepressor-like protein
MVKFICKADELNLLLWRQGKNKIHVIIDNNDELWFNANNTASALGYKDLRDAIKKHVNKKDILQLQYIDYNCKNRQPQSLYLNEAGLYSLILRSKMPAAINFTDWITHKVLPSIRKYGSYKLKIEYENKLTNILDKINYLEEENVKIKKDLKKESFPNGGIVYAIDYSINNENIYRIGMTTNMSARKQIYDTHTFHKHDVVLIKETNCPIKLEMCIRALLYDFRYRDNKDFYICNLNKIKSVFKTCSKSISCISNQSGGYVKLLEDRLYILNKKKHIFQHKINKLNVFLLN